MYALEYEAIKPIISNLRAIYLNGNHFNCHCSLRWLAQLLIGSNLKVQEEDGLQCLNNGLNKVRVIPRNLGITFGKEHLPNVLSFFLKGIIYQYKRPSQFSPGNGSNHQTTYYSALNVDSQRIWFWFLEVLGRQEKTSWYRKFS